MKIEPQAGRDGRRNVNERRSRTRSLDGLSLGLLCILLWVSGTGMAKAGWLGQLRTLPAVGVLGALAGAALARSRFRWQRAGVFALLYGLFVVGWQAARTLDDEIPWGDRAALLAGQVEAYLGGLMGGG